MPQPAPSQSPATADADPCALDEAVFLALQQGLSAEMMPTVINAFIVELDERLTALNAAAQLGDWRSAGRHGHVLKGTAATLGAMALSETAGRIEAAGEAGDGGAVLSNTEHLQQQARSLRRLLSLRYPHTTDS